MMDDNDNSGNKQHNNQTTHGRTRRKRVVASGNLTNDHVSQLTQQSTNNKGEQMGRRDDDNGQR
jgi:hypothetical protein